MCSVQVQSYQFIDQLPKISKWLADAGYRPTCKLVLFICYRREKLLILSMLNFQNILLSDKENCRRPIFFNTLCLFSNIFCHGEPRLEKLSNDFAEVFHLFAYSCLRTYSWWNNHMVSIDE